MTKCTMTIPGVAVLLVTLAEPCIALEDTDGDGVTDNIDNCVLAINADQRDTNGDGIGNACDPDLNDDCSINFVDLQAFTQVFFAADDDADLTGDGFVNFADLAIVEQMFFAAPGPTGAQSVCSCVPPASAGPNAEFDGDDVFLVGSLAGAGAAVPGLNNFADQGGGVYVARIYARSPGSFDYRVTNASATIDYCTDNVLVPYDPVEVPVAGCATPGPLEIPAAGCYDFVLDTGGEVLPASVEVALVERLGAWDFDIDASGATIAAPNGVSLVIPAGAVAAPMTLTVAELPCAQADALFANTTLDSHDKRCIGGFIGEPSGFAFAQSVAVTMPAATVVPADEIVVAVSNTLGRQDYLVTETEVTYDSTAATASATIDELSLYAVAAATEQAPLVSRGPALPACCSQTPTPIDCCCTTYTSTSTAGDAASTDCDCELLGSDIETEFPLCPGAPVFVDKMFYSSENCPDDFTATLSLPDTTQWVCEERIAEIRLAGTNSDGQSCSMPVPFTWSVDDPSVASVDELPPGTSARITGLSGGTTTLNAGSNVGSQFSFTTPLTVVNIDGDWVAFEDGGQTCVISGGEPFVETDSGDGIVTVSTSNCNTIGFEVLFPNLDGTSGPLTVTGSIATPLQFSLQAVSSSNTLACAIFFATNAMDIDFGEPLCSQDCQALSCSETVQTDGGLGPAAVGAAAADSSWTFNASWSESGSIFSVTCSGSSELIFIKL